MKIIFEKFFIFVLMAALIAGTSSSAHAQKILSVVVYGDSLTSGYQLQREQSFPLKLKRKLQEIGYTEFEVINMSIPGETTAGGVDRLNSLVSMQPDVVIVELGNNDVIRGLKPEMIYDNLNKIVHTLRNNGVYVILVGIKAPDGMGYSYIKQIEAIYERVASYAQVPFYPMALEGVIGHPEYTLADGYHPNSKGVDVMVEALYRLVDAGMRWKLETLRYRRE